VRWSVKPVHWTHGKDTSHDGPRPVCTTRSSVGTEGRGCFRPDPHDGQTIRQALVDAELTAVIGAAPFDRTETRLTERNGARTRILSSTAGVTWSCESRSCGSGRVFPTVGGGPDRFQGDPQEERPVVDRLPRGTRRGVRDLPWVRGRSVRRGGAKGPDRMASRQDRVGWMPSETIGSGCTDGCPTAPATLRGSGRGCRPRRRRHPRGAVPGDVVRKTATPHRSRSPRVTR